MEYFFVEMDSLYMSLCWASYYLAKYKQSWSGSSSLCYISAFLYRINLQM